MKSKLKFKISCHIDGIGAFSSDIEVKDGSNGETVLKTALKKIFDSFPNEDLKMGQIKYLDFEQLQIKNI